MGARSSLAALLLLACACAGRLDVERARGLLARPSEPETPRLAFDRPSQLPAPEGLRAVAGELRSVPLKWDPLLSGDVAGYVVERARAEEDDYAPVAAVPGRFHTVHVDRGPPALADGTFYWYRIRAFVADGSVSRNASAAVSARTAPPPAPPRWLRAYSDLPRRIALTWRDSDDRHATGYRIYRSPSAGGPFERIGSRQGRFETTYVDRELGDLRSFYYRVSAVNAAGGEGLPTAEVRAVTKPEPLPPFRFRVQAQELGVNHLAWEPNVERDLVGYRVERLRRGSPEPELVARVGPEATSLADEAVGAGEVLDYRIVALDRDGLTSAPAALGEVESPGYALRSRVTPEGIVLEWDPRRDEGYVAARVYRIGSLRRVERARVEEGRFLDTDVQPGRAYRHVVVLERPDGSHAPASRPWATQLPADWTPARVDFRTVPPTLPADPR